MESIGQTGVELSSVVGIVLFCLGLVVGIGGMWLAWRIVRKLPPDEADHERTPAVSDEETTPNPEA
ncbi:MAG: hypothetical protein OXL38_02640 [Gammaproteobacteria bacterium]|nr:hypothetical protein [Gammaproteobacteria bacterium]